MFNEFDGVERAILEALCFVCIVTLGYTFIYGVVLWAEKII